MTGGGGDGEKGGEINEGQLRGGYNLGASQL